MHARATTAHRSPPSADWRPEAFRRLGGIEARRIVGTLVDGITLEQTVGQVIHVASRRCSAMVCVANVHMLMEAYDDPEFARQLDSADLVVPDGMPLVW